MAKYRSRLAHFADTLAEKGAWIERLHGIRANASMRSHQELNEAPA